MSDREPFPRSGDGDLEPADARDVTGDDRERLADDRDALADERAELAGLRDSLGDQRELELMRYLDDKAGPAGGVAARSEVAQLAFALDRVRLAEAAIRRAELDRAQALEALDRVAARRQRDQARVERDDALGAMAGMATGGLGERAWAEQRRDFVAFHPGLVPLPAGGHPVERFQRLGPVHFGPPDRRLGQPDPIERERQLRHLRPRRHTPS